VTLAARLTPKASLVLTLCWVAILGVTGSTDALLFMAPALLIVVPLLSGRYVGEELIARLARRPRRKARPARASAWSLPPMPAFRPAGRDRLIASGLAKRPPPASLLPQN
jgi:hypothetical protein